MVSGALRSYEADRRVRKQLRRVHAGDALLVCGISPARIVVVNRQLVVVAAHPAEKNRPTRSEAARIRRPVVVPLADPRCGVARFAELLGPKRRAAWNDVVRDRRQRTIQASSRQQHRATRHANRRHRRPHVERVREGETTVDETIEVRSSNVPVSQRANRIGPLIVAQQKRHIGRAAQQIAVRGARRK